MPSKAPDPTVALIILNYNGLQWLEKLLASVNDAISRSTFGCRTLILDNSEDPVDGTWLEANLKRVHPQPSEYIRSSGNHYLHSYNELASQLTEDVLIFLNNDLHVDPNFIDPLVQPFSEVPELFSVCAASMDWDGTRFTSGPARINFHHGSFYTRYEIESQSRQWTLFASGGFMAVSRSKFLELNGFSKRFYPGYCEDLDLCYRAWSESWPSLYEPASRCFHQGGGSFKSDTATYYGRLHTLLFEHLYFRDPGLRIKRAVYHRYRNLRADTPLPEKQAWRAWCDISATDKARWLNAASVPGLNWREIDERIRTTAPP